MICAWTYVYTVVDAADRLIINFLSDLKFSIFFWIIQICVCLMFFYESQKYVCLQTAVVEENVKSQVKNTFIRIKQYFSKGTPASTFCIHHQPCSVRHHHITLNPSLRNTFWSKQPDARVRKKPLASC